CVDWLGYRATSSCRTSRSRLRPCASCAVSPWRRGAREAAEPRAVQLLRVPDLPADRSRHLLPVASQEAERLPRHRELLLLRELGLAFSLPAAVLDHHRLLVR